jgi:hypothetical protein
LVKPKSRNEKEAKKLKAENEGGTEKLQVN